MPQRQIFIDHPTISGGAITFRAVVPTHLESPQIIEKEVTDPILIELLENHLRPWYEKRRCGPITVKSATQFIGHPRIKFKVGVFYAHGMEFSSESTI